ncbi:hypothetical protein [Granulicoccus sp. GXG6511]|uniref:hypothetical protein n=1 Tax=Granulicoccus sp. GXG6511 TaxID=3381351 RepID=UPI003D7CB62B
MFGINLRFAAVALGVGALLGAWMVQRPWSAAPEPAQVAPAPIQSVAPPALMGDGRVAAGGLPTSDRATIAIIGTGFTPGLSLQVDVDNGATHVGGNTVAVAPDGTFTTTIKPVAPWQVGAYFVQVQRYGTVMSPPGTGQRLFTLERALPSPPALDGSALITTTAPTERNGPITITGSGFPPGFGVRVSVNEDLSSVLPVDLNVYPDHAGNFTLSATPATGWQSDKGYGVTARLDDNQAVEASFKTPHF